MTILEDNNEPKIFEIDGEKYMTCSDFAKKAGYTRQNISLLCIKGNVVRKLKHIKVGMNTMIAVTELEDFPFKASHRAKPHTEF